MFWEIVGALVFCCVLYVIVGVALRIYADRH
jgi:hypothetical protein